MSTGLTYILSLSVMLVFLFPGSALPHGGGLDGHGCHYNHTRGGYHCHRGPFEGKFFSTKSEMLQQQVGQPAPQPSASPEPEQPVGLLPHEPPSIAAPLPSRPGAEYRNCLDVIEGETVELAPVTPVQRTGVDLQEIGHPTAQARPCTPFFAAYSNVEIVDAVVRIRETWMTIAGVEKKPEMLGKADDPYIHAGTVCQDMTLAHVSPSEMKNDLRMRRNARARKVRCLGEYRHQMQTAVAEGPLMQPATGDRQSMATHEHDLDTRETVSQISVYDIQAYCRKVADAIGGSYAIEESCQRSEQDAQQELTGVAMPSRVSHYCQQVGAAIGGSYKIMLTCVKREIEAKNRLD